MRLSDKYRPNCLAEVVGQPAVRRLEQWARSPHKACIAMEGQRGTGKSSAARCLAMQLGATEEDLWSGLFEEKGADFSVDRARSYFESHQGGSGLMKLLPAKPGGWNVLLLEEMEVLSPQCVRYLKVALDGPKLPKHCIVIATSNDLSKLEKAFMERWDIYRFQSGQCFAGACVDRLAEVWRLETGQSDLPPGWKTWGWDEEGFSMRAALNDLGRTAQSVAQCVAA